MMFIPTLQSRASIDLGVGLVRDSPLILGNRNRMVRNHPPRLQHSPSLPNIWFPPHSGPIPPQLEELKHESLQRPPSPPSTTTGVGPALSKKRMEHRETLSFGNLSSYLPETEPLKIQRHRRIDRDHGHSLLTPPLTPSSSLRTAASLESSNNPESSQEGKELHEGEVDRTFTHFLLLGNISKQIPPDNLKLAIVDSLTSNRVDNSPDTSSTLSVPTSGARSGPLSEDSIKGVYVRLQKSNGIVVLAFFDSRHAAIAHEIISAPSSGPLAECVGDSIADDGTRALISCQFILAEELAETIGNSTFLASVDGGFYISVEGKESITDVDTKELRVTDDRDVECDSDVDDELSATDRTDTSIVDGKRKINLTMLKSMLKSFGALKSFSLAESKMNIELAPSAKVFHVEYYDVREANAAYAALNGQVLFGMSLGVFGRAMIDQSHHVPATDTLRDRLPGSSTDGPKNIVPFPSAPGTTTHSDDATIWIGPPGQYSRTRERFAHVETACPPPRSVSAGNDIYSTPPTPGTLSQHDAPSAPSPTYFYTSTPVETTDISHEGRGVSGLPFDTAGRPYPPQSAPDVRNDSERPRNPSFDRTHNFADGNIIPQEGEIFTHHDPGIQFYGPHHDCYYCPSRSAPGAMNNCYAGYSTPSPLYYQPLQTLPSPSLNMSFPPPPLSIRRFGHEYDASHAQSTNVNTNWAFEHPVAGASRPVTTDCWFPETTGILQQNAPNRAPYYSQQIPEQPGYAPYYPALTKPVQLQNELLLSGLPNIYLLNPPIVSPPTSSRVTRSILSQGSSTNNGREPPVPPERNQLNLARIEDGQDTRTTIMIKNIPNKMNDKELVTYISKVCPRKIDFLYLRMDFGNGCNVGYAFVNFINVQDLLLFARKKLGEKWNMFSSEKVLQMSYANYQGKEALVEKFKNSCIMDERESWRPKIFYSEPGPEQGLPEPFPVPTHMKRKERSSSNRGALYVPGIGRSPLPQLSMRRHRPEEQRTRYADRGRRDAQETDSPTMMHSTVRAMRRRSQSKSRGAA